MIRNTSKKHVQRELLALIIPDICDLNTGYETFFPRDCPLMITLLAKTVSHFFPLYKVKCFGSRNDTNIHSSFFIADFLWISLDEYDSKSQVYDSIGLKTLQLR
ncbi:hypothetical protein J6590_090150 [Homalodisca vitripennis]|nr:hypothetical protein J6590_090150 [Homalodisca vitripennis]